jgi:superfamily I DNA/RNA helicase/RecB family exonuclease
MSATSTDFELSPAQRRAVEWGEGPLMVLAGAGTGKTTVVIERVRHLLEHDASLTPENILVLTYNVRAAAELSERFEAALGLEPASRVWVHNFHSFGYRLLREHRAEAGLARDADLLDGVGQRLLLRDLLPQMRHFLYYDLSWNAMDTFGGFAEMISRAKDELVTPGEYADYAARQRAVFISRHEAGAFDEAVEDLRDRRTGDEVRRIRTVRNDLVKNGEEAGGKIADREARRTADGGGQATSWARLSPEQQERARELKPSYLRDAEALEVLRVEEEATVYGLYQDELAERGQLDFGEQMSRTIDLLIERPNLVARYQKQFRHVLVDEFQDANMAQILLLELIGRGPDKPDNVVVVGDDDQSIYRFRGASDAAFSQFRDRFGASPTFDPSRAAAPVQDVPLLENRRSVANVISAANRVIGINEYRLKTDKPLEATRPAGKQVEVVIAADAQDEAEAIVERIREAYEAMPEPRQWRDIAVLYRRHTHRAHIVDRLRRAGIPFSVVGATGLFIQPEIRDLEAALRVLADPTDSYDFTRLLTAGPWRFDAAEIMELRRRADWDGRPMLQTAREILEAARQAEAASTTEAGTAEATETDGDCAERGLDPPAAMLRAKLERLFGVIEDLIPRAAREGPAALLEEFVVRTNLVHDLIASGTPEAQRKVLNIARFMRFAADHQASRRRDSLNDFIDYVNLYQEAGGDLDMEAPVTTGLDGVQLMTVYQAKGLEWPVVLVPRILERQFPDTRAERQLLPLELLKQEPPPGHAEEEERRLFFVAMTRARDRLVLTSVVSADGREHPSRFVGEVAPHLLEDRDDDAPAMSPGDVTVVRREDRPEPGVHSDDGGETTEEPASDEMTAVLERQMPVPEPFERRYALRRQAIELMGTLEQLDPDDARARDAVIAELVEIATNAAGAANEDRRNGIDPLTLRVLAMHSPAGEELLRLVSLPSKFSHSQFYVYKRCHLQYAFEKLYKIPSIERKGYFTFGSTMHSAFEDFVKEARAAKAAGEEPQTFEQLQKAFDEHFDPKAFGDTTEVGNYRRRSDDALKSFYERELKSKSEAVGLERYFVLELDAPDGSEPIRVNGVIDRVDRHPDGSIEVIDYKTGRSKSQSAVDKDDQLSTYALAMANGAVTDEATGEPLPAASKLTLYFTESDMAVSTTRSPEQLEQHAADLTQLAMSMRAGDFAAMPDYRKCDWCDFNRVCPSRFQAPEG